MSKDKLFLLNPNFVDPRFPGQRFYCWHCALIEGILSGFPELAEKIEVERIDWQRPRHAAIKYVGENNQSLPLLVLPEGDSSKYQSGSFKGRQFINDKDKILAALAERHGFPEPHP